MKIKLTIVLLSITAMLYAQDIKKDTIKLDEVLVEATRANKIDPFTTSSVSKKELEKQNLGQDIPQLLNFLPSVVTTSDAGAGIGYTGIRVRGSDASRVNVTINGIPLNDSESQGVFWVNLPDFVSSVESIQLQRGVGTSTNGAGAFGASLSLATDGIRDESYAEIGNSFGSFGTHRHNVKFGTGTINDHFNFSGRVSTIQSDGYIDRASSDLRSVYLEANYFNANTSIKALAFAGAEITYQSWFGIDATTLENDRTFNPAGAIFDDAGNITGFYENQVDDYKQDHYQLHINHQFNTNWTGNLAFHYTYGRGFFEEYHQDESFAEYGFEDVTIGGETINTTDLVRRKWLDNDFYGTTFSAHYKQENLRMIIGGAYSKYDGDHFGRVIWAEIGNPSNTRNYYDNTGVKKDFNMYAKANYTVNDNWRLFGDMQYRTIDYSANGTDEGPSTIAINDDFNFFNPKAGVSYILDSKNDFYLSYARANKEPKRSDYESDVKPESEQLDDFELGYNYRSDKLAFQANMYYMAYKNQLVLTGELNNVGTPIAENVGDSYRLGLELDGSFRLSAKWSMQTNVALSQNKNLDKFESIDGVLVDLGNTNLSYSPEIVAGNRLTFSPKENISFSLLSKYVGEQYMGNIDNETSKLDAYFINDINIQYIVKPKKLLDEIVLTALVNNVFDNEYVSNGYFFSYDDTWTNPGQTTTIYGAGFYPQAGINFLTGVTLKF